MAEWTKDFNVNDALELRFMSRVLRRQGVPEPDILVSFVRLRQGSHIYLPGSEYSDPNTPYSMF
ncbi:unnamed protein product [Clonostachys rosea]|uniref:Uncharacterized protein n=1 Tax=Bionectria ochroleuca TaxID=29856 RepID=A0ABY6UI60_BIOOC|nr:unnamed protein product [Clonostachys rosea]